MDGRLHLLAFALSVQPALCLLVGESYYEVEVGTTRPSIETEPGNFGRTVMALLERDYGVAPLEEALRAPVMGRAALANAVS